MPRGGARINSGPPPDPEALRRDRASDRDGWTDLPAQGRRGRPPAFPLMRYRTPAELELELESTPVGDAIAERERVVWAKIWCTPQAVAWSRLGWTYEVALYVRGLVLGADFGEVKAMAEARQWSDRLGLNPAAMLRLRWRIARDEVAEKRTRTTAAKAAPAGSSMRERLKALDGGGA